MIASSSHTAPMPDRRLPRLAGIFYVIIILSGITATMILRAPMDAGDLRFPHSQDTLFRLSLMTDLVMLLADVALAVTLFEILRRVAPHLALIATVFRLIQASLIGASLIALTALPDVAAAGHMARAATFWQLHTTGYDVGLAFFAVTCATIALALWYWPAAPNWIGWLLMASAPVYMGGAALRIMAPGAYAAYEMAYVVPLVAEVSFALWLLLKARA